MISFDTNILIRYVVQNDLHQYEFARNLFIDKLVLVQKLIFILLAILEAEWVLRSAYKYSKPAILSTFSSLLLMDEVAIEEPGVLENALRLWKMRAVNFANCLILARGNGLGCAAMATFDSRASKLPGCVLLKA